MHRTLTSWRPLALALAALAAPLLAPEAAYASNFYYPDPVTPYGVIVDNTYQLMMWMSIAILIIVEVALVAAIIKFRKRPGENRIPETWHHNTKLELIWTVIPFIMLIIICVPTFQGLAYLADIPKTPQLTLEVVGRQFFWEYRYPELNVTFTSTMRTEANAAVKPGDKAWDDMALFMPINKKMLVKLTGADVIHSWWVPSYGLQQMTTPGNLVQIPLEITKPGDYAGACAYLCGPYHGAMDIKVKGVDQATFDTWVLAHKATSPIEPIAKVGKIGMVAAAPKKPEHGTTTTGEGHETAPQATTAPEASAAPVVAVDTKALAAKGKGLFEAKCVGCHGAAGAGIPGLFPPLAGAEQVTGDKDELINILLAGKSGEITVKGQKYNGMMPAFGTMTDEEVAAVATYIRSSFGNTADAVTPDQVKAKR